MTDFNEAMRQLAAPIQELADAHQSGWDGLRQLPADHAARRDWLRRTSEIIRRLSDAHGAAEEAARAEAPPECDLRARVEHDPRRARAGSLNDYALDSAGWLVLANDGVHVLEIFKGPEEWCHEAEARFHRACSETAEATLAKMIAGESK